MGEKTITRRAFLRDSAALLLGTAAVCVFERALPPDAARALENSGTDMSLSIVRDTDKCIACGRCVEICSERQGLNILELRKRSDGKTVSSLKNASSLAESRCIGCGQCARHCPTGAISARDGLGAVNAALKDSRYRKIVWQFAPSAQHVVSEEFRMRAGTDVCGKLAAAVYALDGRSMAFSTDFGADVTIMEEATELVSRLRDKAWQKPLMTSCCPGWVNYVELNHPELIPHLSSCKSPMEMLGALVKTQLPQRLGVAVEEIYHIAVMPCTAKKYERARAEMATAGVPSVDAVLTVPEFKKLLEMNGIDLSALEDEPYNDMFAGTSGAGRIFGATGGVCEAALRTAYYLLTGCEPPQVEFTALRGSAGVKEASVEIGGQTVRVCVVNGIANVKDMVEEIRAGNCAYDFVEVMACRGGCSGGGGTPALFGDVGVRHRGLYRYDDSAAVRSSHNNATLSRLYEDYLGSPCSGLAEELLHTTYDEHRGNT